MTCRWVTLENLRRADIMAVLQRVVGVLVVSNFFPLEASEHGAEGVARLEQGAYSNAPEVGKAGNMPSVYEITGDTARQAYYFHEGPHVMQQFRAAFWPYMQPMDLVR